MKNQMGELALCAWLLLLSSSLAPLCASDDTLRSGQSLLLNQTLVSNGKTFALGFFAPGGGINSSRRYLGIWYNMIPGPRTLVWVANRERPFTDSSVALRFSNDSNQLVVSDASGAVLWSSNATGTAPDARNMSAVLRDTGNLEVRARPEMDVLWQSFDHPADTILPGMKLWVNKKLHVANRIVSWKDADDPSPGLFSYGIDPAAIVQMMLWKGNRKYFRNGIWDASLTRGGPMTASGYASSFSIQRDRDVSIILFTPSDTTLLQRMVIDHTGSIRLFSWNSSISNWTSLLWFGDPKPCDAYGACGPSGVCQNTGPSRPSCSCLEDYLPRAQSEWDRGDYSGGCVNRGAPTSCDGEDGFRKMGNVEVPDKMVYLQDVANASGCEAACRGNCSCAAYSFASTVQSYLNKSIPRCLIWVEEMIDLVQNSANGDELHLRVPGAGTGASDDKSKKWMLPVVLPSALLAGILCVALLCCCWKNKAAEMIKGRWKNIGKKTREVASAARLISSSGSNRHREFSGARDLLEDDEKEGKEMDLPMLSFEAIVTATDNFSDSNKLGQGGFGDVYRGVLPGGEMVAVKRLSRSSGQGVDEFKTELVLIAKLQHRNLVRLLGCCIQGEEKILIYEYMPNKSLDSFLFDPERQTMLDWSRRFDIIEGVARGLLYLHRDSRVRVVHRDMKASNILLDAEMNPKISDFGMARIFGGNQNADSTTRVVGTFGYMPPEYAMEGLFSVKSDVYSFGVLMLEIVSGRRNNRCGLMNVNLLRHAWQLWTAGRAEELVDPCMRGCSSAMMQQVLRCVQIGLLCVQDHAHDRPTMSSVVIMLGSDAGVVNPVPKQPTFTVEGSPSETDSLKAERDGNHSINAVTVSIVDGR